LIKALLFDIDGVLIHHKTWFTLSDISEKYIDADKTVTEFHEGVLNQDCDRGLKDPLKEIEPFLEKIGWEYGSEAYFEMKYKHESRYIDHKMINEIAKLRRNGILTYIASNQNYHRKAFLIETMNLHKAFDESFFSCDFGHIKPEQEYWINVMNRINNKFPEIGADEVLFFDDRIENVESAQRFGMKVMHVKEANDLLKEIESIKSITTAST
jgi:HAD superfamily hydrolase (TIGR01509 family)